ncbi:zonular occludens toxin domain-containing protein [Wukongibacter baidiensis]|uniref:zonular occludens toxin domain-containing protein n=1 Tax=Wukongibacter baidiensis TaxID=1723361 RepID=UPI003D7F27C7
MAGLYAVSGKLGSGKSIIASALVCMLRTINKHKGTLANYNFKGSKLIETFQDVRNADDSYIILDEVHMFANGRHFRKNDKITEFCLITRKQGLDVFLISQRFMQIDVSIREIIDILFYCKMDYETKDIHVYVIDLDTNECINTWIIPYSVYSLFFGVYDTKEMPTNFMRD